MNHLLSIEALSAEEIARVIDLAAVMKGSRDDSDSTQVLRGQTWALVFSKSSTRTRVSFEVGIRELGGDAIFLSANDIQLGRGEPIKDTARVLGRFVDGAIIRTFAQRDVEEFAQFSGIPTINALTDEEHPCQILSDLFTIREKLGSYERKTICFAGDGASNVARSWVWAAKKLDFTLRIAAPPQYQPPADVLEQVDEKKIMVTAKLLDAARGADVLYTDVWVSMGREDEAAFRTAQLGGFQINRRAREVAAPGALVMHCLPAYRGKEIDADFFEEHSNTIFDQAENRLHTQKAILKLLAT